MDPKGQSYDPGWTGRNFHEGDTATLSDGWTLVFPLISRAQAISVVPSQISSAVSIAGKGQENSLVIQGQDKSNHRGIYLYYSKSISDKDWESNPPKVNIDNVDLKITNVRYGVYQYSPSIVEISNEKTVIDCSTYAGSQALYAVSMLSSGELKPFSISIESGHIEVTVAPKGTSYSSSGIIYQRMQTGSSVISLNLKREGVTLFKGIKNESFYTFDMDGEQVTTNIGGQMLHLQNEGSVTPTQVYYRTAQGKAPAVTQLRGGHTAAIFNGAHLNLSSKNIKGAIVFNVGYGGRLSIGSEANQPKVEITGGFEFRDDSGKSQVYLGPGSLLNGFIFDQTKASTDGSSPTFLMKNSTWDVNSQLSRVQNLESKVSGLKLDHATVNLTSEQDAQGQQTFSDLTIGSLESDRGVFILDVDIENQKNDKVAITEGIPEGSNLQEAQERAAPDPTESLLKNNSVLRFVFSGTSSGGDSGVLVEAPIVVEGTRFQLEPKELEVNGKKAKYQAVDVGTYNYYLANEESSTDPNTRNWYLTQCKEGECLPLPSPPEPVQPDDPDKPDKPQNPDTPYNPGPGTDKPDPGPALPVYSPSAEAVFALSGMGSQTAFYQGQLSDLRERLGEIRRDVRGEVREGLWASIGAQKDRIAGFSSTSFKSTVYRFNFGYDTAVGNWLIGGNFKYASANQKTKDAFFKAKGDAHSEGLNAYAVWHNEKGCYADLILSADRYHQRLNTSMLDGTGVRGTYWNWGVGVSAEVGKKSFINAQKTWFVEPQLQLAYYRIHGDNFTLSNGMKVKQGNFNSLTGRLGLALGRDIKSSEGQNKGQVYLRAGVKNEFLGKQKVTINGERFSDKLTGNRVYYGLATDWLVKKNLKVYGHIEREKGVHYTKEIEAQVGLKWQF